jgi:probable HAF family extracellular repeat protein
MSKFKIRSTTVLAIAFCFSAVASAQSHPFISFDVPGAVGRTSPLKLNSSGQIVGFALSNAYHGFVRNPDGQITLIDAPGATDTNAVSINSNGQVVGYAQISFGPEHGFLRSGGHFSEIMYPGAIQTWALSINDSGVIMGQYSDSNSVFHGFVREASGTYTAFDTPGAGTGNGQGTTPKAMNNTGQITGQYMNSTGTHGFVRDAAGNITTFDVPGATDTSPADINDNGDVTGADTDGKGVWVSFIRHSDGSLTNFAVSGSLTTFPASINHSGYVCGVANDTKHISHGFLRNLSGNILLYSGPQPNNGGACVDVNDNLHATGTYIDSSFVSHAWVK